MKSHYRAVVIGGGVVGASVLYHLTKLGWSEVALIERKELTAGSTWHAAAGFHAINADVNIAALQSYTIDIYPEIEEASGQSVGLHMPGGIALAGTPERWEFLKSAWAIYQTIGIEDCRLLTPAEVKEMTPVVDVSGIYGGLYDPKEGHLDPYGTTHAYAGAARKKGADVILRNRVTELTPRADGGWDVVTEQGTISAEHVVNAGGLWAKQLGHMAGVDLPVTPMEHHYLVTEAIPEVAALDREMAMIVDLEGFTYFRQEGQGCLLGVYELNPKHWHVDGAPWDYGMDLIPEDIDRISPELEKGFDRFPALQEAGIKRWVNGAFTFTPDGNPLVGPVPGLSNYWTACGVMAGFSQGGGVGKSLAEWMIEGEPEGDVFAMDVGRYGPWASNRTYLKDTTRQFYSRRFVLTYPNEQLPAGRPLRVPPSYDALSDRGAQWGASWGLELPLYFAPDKDFVETPTQKRSNAHDIVGREAIAVREGVGLLDTSGFARYRVEGPDAAAWLDRLLANKLPAVGRVRLSPMFTPKGRLAGDLTVFNWGSHFELMGSYYLRSWHLRWFDDQRGAADVRVSDISDATVGWSIAGPKSRELLARLADGDVSHEAFRFMSARELDVGPFRAKVARLSVTGELGFEINVPAAEHLPLYRLLKSAGADIGLVDFGYNALNALRLEKSFGIWNAEFTRAYTPAQCGFDRFIAFDKGDFIGREAAVAERDGAGPDKLLVTLDIAADDADASAFEPVWHGDARVGFVTSGGYGHTIGKSLALAYVDRAAAGIGTELGVHVVGDKRPATVIPPSPYDPDGKRMRGA
ncbi:MAG: FAD-dependent oxidoreductase [Pseudomonadota bacterium]